jgi:hypothetical protein
MLLQLFKAIVETIVEALLNYKYLTKTQMSRYINTIVQCQKFKI